jgi:hypothetical protein
VHGADRRSLTRECLDFGAIGNPPGFPKLEIYALMLVESIRPNAR